MRTGNAAKAALGEVEAADIRALEGRVYEVIAGHCESAAPNGTIRNARAAALGCVIGFVFADQLPECICVGLGEFCVFRVSPFDIVPHRD